MLDTAKYLTLLVELQFCLLIINNNISSVVYCHIYLNYLEIHAFGTLAVDAIQSYLR